MTGRETKQPTTMEEAVEARQCEREYVDTATGDGALLRAVMRAVDATRDWAAVEAAKRGYRPQPSSRCDRRQASPVPQRYSATAGRRHISGYRAASRAGRYWSMTLTYVSVDTIREEARDSAVPARSPGTGRRTTRRGDYPRSSSTGTRPVGASPARLPGYAAHSPARRTDASHPVVGVFHIGHVDVDDPTI